MFCWHWDELVMMDVFWVQHQPRVYCKCTSDDNWWWFGAVTSNKLYLLYSDQQLLNICPIESLLSRPQVKKSPAVIATALSLARPQRWFIARSGAVLQYSRVIISLKNDCKPGKTSWSHSHNMELVMYYSFKIGLCLCAHRYTFYVVPCTIVVVL